MITKVNFPGKLVCYLLCISFITTACQGSINPTSTSSPDPDQLTLYEFYLAYDGNKTRIIEALDQANVTPRIEAICIVQSRVECYSWLQLLEDIRSGAGLANADINVLIMSMNELGDAFSEGGGNTINACLDGGFDVYDFQVSNLSSPTVQSLSDSRQEIPLNEGGPAMSNCQESRQDGASNALTRAGLSTDLYAEAAKTAMQAMDDAVSDCHNASSMIAIPESDENPEANPTTENSQSQLSLTQGLLFTASTTSGIISIGLGTTELATVAAVAGTAGTGGLAAPIAVIALGGLSIGSGFWNLTDPNDTASNVSAATDVAGGTMDAIAAARSGNTAGWIGVAVSAAIVGVTIWDWISGQSTDEPTPTTEDPSEMTHDQSDAMSYDEETEEQMSLADATPESTEGSDPQIPSEGAVNCEEVAAKWAAFKDGCLNEINYYECVRFVAQMHGCGDPLVMYPSPLEDYGCHSEKDKKQMMVDACVIRRKIIDMIGKPNPDSRVPPCGVLIDSWLKGIDGFRPLVNEQVCMRIQENPTGDSGLCDNFSPNSHP